MASDATNAHSASPQAPNPTGLSERYALALLGIVDDLRRTEPASIRAVFATWRSSAQVGALSALGSACWFSAFALAPVALVRAVGQVEILFTLAFSRFYLREAARPADVAGSLVVAAGVVLVLLGSG